MSGARMKDLMNSGWESTLDVEDLRREGASLLVRRHATWTAWAAIADVGSSDDAGDLSKLLELPSECESGVERFDVAGEPAHRLQASDK